MSGQGEPLFRIRHQDKSFPRLPALANALILLIILAAGIGSEGA